METKTNMMPEQIFTSEEMKEIMAKWEWPKIIDFEELMQCYYDKTQNIKPCYCNRIPKIKIYGTSILMECTPNIVCDCGKKVVSNIIFKYGCIGQEIKARIQAIDIWNDTINNRPNKMIIFKNNQLLEIKNCGSCLLNTGGAIQFCKPLLELTKEVDSEIQIDTDIKNNCPLPDYKE